MKSFCLSLVMFIGMAAFVNAQTESYKFNRLDLDKGLSHNTIRCFFKDRKGFVWIGTVSGLNRFDGSGIKVYQNIPGDSTSLSDNEILNIFEDPEGNIWLNTWSGTDVYDPVTEKFHHHTGAFLSRYHIPDSRVLNITSDVQGNYWFVQEKGVYEYDPQSKKTFHLLADSLSAGSSVSTLAHDGQGRVWLLYENGVLEAFEKKNRKVAYRNHWLQNEFPSGKFSYHMMADSDGDLWIYIHNNNKGVFFFDHVTHTFTQISGNGTQLKLNNNIVRGVVQDAKGIVWVATDHGGINLIDKKKHEVKYLLHNDDDDKSLVQNSVNALYKDRDGFIWAGTYKRGVSFYHEDLIRFPLFRHESANAGSLPFGDINCFTEDKNGNLWIGTNGAGLIYYDRRRNTFRSYVNDPHNDNSLSNNVIVSLCLDHKGRLWIGTFFGGLNLFDGKNFRRYKSHPSASGSIADDSIWEIIEDKENNLWIGTLNAGLDRYDETNNAFVHYRNAGLKSSKANYIPALLQTRDGKLWMGTGDGLATRTPDGKLITYVHNPEDHKSLGHNRILCLLEDKRGLIWIGTKEGLNVFNRGRNEFRLFRTEDGLPHNTIHTLLEDDNGTIWIGTPNGLANLVGEFNAVGAVQSFIIRTFDESDGLQGKQFNEGAALKTHDGELVFGGANGFNAFRPERIAVNKSKPALVFTDFKLFNRSVKPGESVEGSVILQTSIDRTTSITLAHSQNLFSVKFTALSFFHAGKNKYQYKLEGFNKDWITADSHSREVTYTNLDAGNYTFKVRASNNDGIWNDEGIDLRITVLPPFWKSKIAFILYTLVISGALLLARNILLQRERLKFQIEQEHQEAERIQALEAMKTEFFTNVSHEFRTPLTLILTPVEKLLKESNGLYRYELQLISRNAHRLLNLVNELLDLRRLEVKEARYNPSGGDIIKFVKDTVHSFTNLSDDKHISFSWHTDVDAIETMFDRDKLERILFNLLSNAFKFTQPGGTVSVHVSLDEDRANWLQIKVNDTGIGIEKEQQQKVFERFFQADVPGMMVNQGSGIGLSIACEFAKIMGGFISLESTVGAGSCFTVHLPVETIHTTHEGVSFDAAVNNSKPVLLLTEDNDDFRSYLRDNLKSQYTIHEAVNGVQALQLTQTILPDLIVSDVMMPEMNGIEMCQRIKNDAATSHIPVILLTARSTEEQKLEGLASGADDYITKPFNFEILQLRIKNLVQKREAFQKDLRKQIEVKGSDIHVTSLDERLIKKAIQIVEEHITDPDFSVEDLSDALNMSRVHLYKKLMAIAGKSPLEFIRVIRLQRAAQLLEKSQLTVAEVAYQVGFNNPKYFSRYFREEYKMLPSAYAASKREENSAA